MEINNGIYAIKNIIDGKMYVGSSVNFKQRRKQHFTDLRCGRHYNIHLQRAFNKYGENSFEWIVLEETNNLQEKEKEWIIKTEATNKTKGYNVTDEPYAPMRGKKFTPEQICNIIANIKRGSEHPNAKINDQDIFEIFKLYSEGFNQKEIAMKIGTHQTNISFILKGKGWKHLNITPVENRTNNISGCVGVYYHKSGKWIAEIIHNKKYINLGSFINKNDAIKARKEAEVNLGL